MSTPRAPRMSVEARRAQLIEVGQQVFSERAYDDVSTDELSQLAGISKGLLYHYFGNKRGFYVATIRAVAEEFAAAVSPTPEGDVAAAMLETLSSFLDFIEARPTLYRALIRGGVGADSEVEAIVEGLRRLEATRVLERVGVTDPDPVLWLKVYGWVGFAEAASLGWLEQTAASGERLVSREVLIGLLVEALAAALGPHLEIV